MLTISSLGVHIATRRRALGLSQTQLARSAGVSRATLDALENGRSGEIGFSKVTKILAALGLVLAMNEANAQRRPTLDDLMRENRDD